MTPVVINLPHILHEALEGAKESITMAKKHASAVSKRAEKTQDPEDHLAAVRAFQGLSEAHSTVAALAGTLIATLTTQGDEIDLGEDDDDPNIH